MLNLNEANPQAFVAKNARVEYKNKNIKIFYLADLDVGESISDDLFLSPTDVAHRVVKVYRFVVGATKRNLGKGDFVIVEEWLPALHPGPNQECVVDRLMPIKEARREWKKHLAWTPAGGRQGSCVQLASSLVPNWVKPFNEEQPAF